MSKRYLVLHGHFYQPPRENPWVEEVEMQPSAWPHHDWNERVHAECYGPNGASRLLDAKGRIRDIVNNYADFSFNFGPTLLSWIEEKHPDTYARILAGDRLSRERLGHGNALAQAYNHVIMPLAGETQKALQIRWGVRDFERRFGRKPEGLWLPETAVDMETVRCLIREGVRFTVLSPTQASRVRPLHTDHWRDVSAGGINPRRPYRVFALSEDGTPLEKGFLDVFFYDGPLSHGVGFEHLLTDARRFAERIAGAYDPHDLGDQLVSVCTDGESYGHHEPFADMCAAYLFRELCAERELIPVNYAWYLDRHPPEFEVRLTNAASGGTAWSCAHGVGRWKEDCGCSTGGRAEWNQKWRAPLRAALDLLAEAAGVALEREGPKCFRDWNAVQNEAVDAWDRNPEVRKTLWIRHPPRTLSPAPSRGQEGSRGTDIVELLRFSHYMFTSCGWFFAELTGLEATQVLKYALRTLQLLESLDAPAGLRTRYLSLLAGAKSNLGGKSGDAYFLELEDQSLPAPAYLALARWTLEFSGEPAPYSGALHFRFAGETKRNFADWKAFEFRFQREFADAETVAWLAFAGDGLRSDVHLILPEGRERLEEIAARSRDPGDLALASAGKRFRLAAGALPVDIRDRAAAALRRRFWRENSASLDAVASNLERGKKEYARLEWPFPSTMLQMLQGIENFHLVEELESGLRAGSLPSLRKALDMARGLRAAGWHVHLGAIKRDLYERMLDLGREFLADPRGQLEPLFVLLDLVDTLGLMAERTRLENLAHPLHRNLREFADSGRFDSSFPVEEAIRLLDRLNFNTESVPAGPLSRKAGAP